MVWHRDCAHHYLCYSSRVLVRPFLPCNLAGCWLRKPFSCSPSNRCNLILIKTNATPEHLDGANGLIQFSMCLSRTFAPAFIRFVSALPRVFSKQTANVVVSLSL